MPADKTFDFTSFITMVSPFKVLTYTINQLPLAVQDYEIKFEDLGDDKYQLLFGATISNFKETLTVKDLMFKEDEPHTQMSNLFESNNPLMKIKEEMDKMKEDGIEITDENSPLLQLSENKNELSEELDEVFLMLKRYSGTAKRIKFDSFGEYGRLSFSSKI